MNIIENITEDVWNSLQNFLRNNDNFRLTFNDGGMNLEGKMLSAFKYLIRQYAKENKIEGEDINSIMSQALTDKAKLKNFMISKPYEPYDDEVKFQNFDISKHVAFTGRTGDGKTTAFIDLVYKNKFKIPKNIIIFMNPNANIIMEKYFIPSLLWGYKNQNSEFGDEPNIYVFKGSDHELSIAISLLDKIDNYERKLFIIEDMRSSSKNTPEIVGRLLLTAKNVNCQCVVFDHIPSQHRILYQSTGYVVMCNPDISTFNLTLFDSREKKVLDSRFTNIQKFEKNKRSFIYDNNDKRLYWVYGNCPLLRA